MAIQTENRKEQLAQAYQILAFLGFDDHTYTHLTCRTNHQDAFYLQPFGMTFDEIRADNLLTISMDGKVIDGHERITNPTAYATHSAIYRARPDLQAIFHLHTPHMVAVSTLRDGLMPINQWALHFYNRIAYHAYDSLIVDDHQGCQLAKDLSQHSVMLLRHHGAIITGKTIQEAMFYTHHLELACKAQCLTLAMQQPMSTITQAVCEKSVETLHQFEKDIGQRDWQAWVRKIKRNHDVALSRT